MSTRSNDDASLAGRLALAKAHADAYLERNREAIACLNDSIFYFGELGMQEFETSALMTDLLEEAGFHVERNLAGFPTGFRASFGEGQPVVAIHTEYDANPDNSQMPGVAERRSVVEGAPGHCEGHNCNAAVLIAAALATKSAMQAYNLPGSIQVFGAPAEEQLVSRPYYVRDGLFDHVDVCFAPHVGARFAAGYGVLQSALISATFTFQGESAHAGTAPWKARDALDAVVLMDVGMAELREHLYPNSQCQRVILHGGDQPNVIPRTATIWWYFRASSADGAMKLFERARQVAEGAALMSATTCEVEILSAVWPVRCNQVLSDLVERECERVGMPHWSSEETELAQTLQTAAGVMPSGLATKVVKSTGPSVQKPSANDSGDVSWKVPMAKFYFPSNIPQIDFHHWAAGVALATSIAHKGVVAGARVLSGAVLECLMKSDLVAAARTSFAHEIGPLQFKSMLPPDQRPPVELNKETMNKFRTLMKRHYVSQRPLFR